MDTGELRQRLEGFIARETGAAVKVENLRKLPGGASREIWSFDADVGGERLALILRRDPGSSTLQTRRQEEYRVQQAAFAAGVPVPRPYWLAEDDAVLGAAYVMARVEGETLPRRLLRDDAYAGARAAMTAELGAHLARIHTIDVVANGLDFLTAPAPGESPAVAELDRYEQIFRGIAPEPHPVFELAFRWLRQRLPDGAAQPTLVHGDYRIGNVMFGPEGTRAILDWELSHVGDPAEDLGWLCVRAWRFGNDHLPVGGIGDRETLLAAYRDAGGAAVSAERVRFWEVYGNLKWAIICITQAKTHLDGLVKSVELASLGRRTAETELELLELIR